MDKTLWARVVERDHGLCFLCKAEGGEVHHIVPRSHYGKKSSHLFEQEKNMILLCRQCHRTVRQEVSTATLFARLEQRFGYQYEPEYGPYRLEYERVSYIRILREA